MKKYIFLSFISFSISLFSQIENEENKDSLNFYIKKIKDKKLPQEIKEGFATKIVFFSKNVNDSLKFEANIEIALMYFRKRKLDSLKKYSFLAKQNTESLDDLNSTQKAHFYIATYYKYKEILDSSYYHYNTSKNILLNLGNTYEAARRMTNISTIQMRENDLLGAEITIINALKYIEESDFNGRKATLYNNLGLIYKRRKEYKNALKYYEIGFDLFRNDDDNVNIDEIKLNYYRNTAGLYLAKGEYKKANDLLKKGLNYGNVKELFPYNYVSLLQCLTFNNFQLNIENNLLSNYNEVLEISKKENFIKVMASTNNLLAFYFIYKGENKKAIFHAKEGLKYSKQSGNTARRLEALKILSDLTKGEAPKKYLQEYIQLNDSLYSRERLMKNQFAKIRYETEKKEQENTDLKEENTKKQLLLESEQQQKTIGWLLAGTSILVIGFGTSIALSRRKKMLFEAKLQQVEVREKERQQIAKSLHDEVAGDIRMLHLKLAKTNQTEEAKSLDVIKENVRNLSHQLSSESFDKVSFKDQIINLISDFFEIDFRIKPEKIDTVDWQNINNAIKRTLFLTIRESIQNAKKHAAAKNVVLSFSESKNAVFLTISDNGKGFNVAGKKTGIGLKNMKERIEEINGVFSIKSELEKGTNIDIEIPKHGK